ncbi:MAG: hypothetical protein KF893_20540 [Caldilineaceae bacterium]|nr:hypothetical protein [Caldilineaceae bacterium]
MQNRLPVARCWQRGVALAMGILLILALSLLSSRQAAAQQSPILRCRVDGTSIAVAGNATFVIELLNVDDLYGYELTLRFNGARVHFEDADPGRAGVNFQVGDFLSPDFVVLNDVNNTTGQAQLALTQLSPSEPVSGSGELGRATIKGVSSGMVSFSFADVVLSDPTGVAIPVTLQGCSIEVLPGETTPPPPDGDAIIVVEPGAGSTLVYTNTNGLPITIQIPAGAVTDTITLVYTEGTMPSTGPLGLQFAGVHFWLEAYRNNVKIEGFVFQIPIQVELRYLDADVIGLAEESIMLYYFNRLQGAWATDGIEIVDRNLVSNRLFVSLAHLSEFATFTTPSNAAETGSITGEVFQDVNLNGIREIGEGGVRALVKLYLLDTERQWTTLSQADGSYNFRRLPDGVYFIEVVPLLDVNYILTTSATINVQVSNGGGVSGANFGIAFQEPWVLYLVLISQSNAVRLDNNPDKVGDILVFNHAMEIGDE